VSLLLLLLYIIKLIEPSAIKLINIQKDSSDSLAGNDALAGQIFRLTEALQERCVLTNSVMFPP